MQVCDDKKIFHSEEGGRVNKSGIILSKREAKSAEHLEAHE